MLRLAALYCLACDKCSVLLLDFALSAINASSCCLILPCLLINALSYCAISLNAAVDRSARHPSTFSLLSERVHARGASSLLATCLEAALPSDMIE